MRTSARFWGGKNAQLPTDSQFAIYIAQHYRGIITNEATWSSPFVLSMVKGEGRKFAEQSVAQHPAPTEAEMQALDVLDDLKIGLLSGNFDASTVNRLRDAAAAAPHGEVPAPAP